MRRPYAALVILGLACGPSATGQAPDLEVPTEQTAPPPAPPPPAPTVVPSLPEAAPPPPAEPPPVLVVENPPPTTGSKDLPNGSACVTADQCASGLCQGVGCGDDPPGVCVSRARPCTRDRRPFCGCDGQTFATSSSCVNRRYQHEGPCPGSPIP
jgi:hypothetical protein